LADEVADTELLVRSLQVSVENALRDGQTPDVIELLSRLDPLNASLDVMVFPDAGAPQTSTGGQPGHPRVLATRDALATQAELLQVVEEPEGPPRIIAGATLRDDQGAPLGQLVLTRPLDGMERDLRATTHLTLAAVVAFALSTSAALTTVLRWEISTPLARVAQATARLGEALEADLRLPPPTNDELRVLQEGLLGLQDRLCRERDARQAEEERREATERQLREADKLAVVGQLAAGVAHEIGSPLQILMGRARLLADREDVDPEVCRQAVSIEHQAGRIVRIVERLQDVTRRRPPVRQVVDLREPVAQVVWLVQAEAKKRRVTLRFSQPDQPIWVRTDPDEVQQVALNLALNALQATPAGRSVEVRVTRSERCALLHLEDQGTGMEPEVLDRASEPFFTTRADRGGTGLGLAVVEALLARHGATWRLNSEPGRGTLAEVQWPVVEP
jgi:signal transduction histidine kinase